MNNSSTSVVQWLQSFKGALEGLDEFVRGSEDLLGDDGLGIGEDG
jgi:hypothetical protein